MGVRAPPILTPGNVEHDVIPYVTLLYTLHKVVLTSKSVDEILKRAHSNESY